jgi:hypothetical protein
VNQQEAGLDRTGQVQQDSGGFRRTIVRFSTALAIGVLLAAGVAAAVPLPATLVERLYSTGVYPILQRALTSASNLAPFPLIDLLIVVAALWPVSIAIALWRVFRQRTSRQARRLILMVVIPPAATYVAFLLLWGFNYRRLPLDDKLAFDKSAITSAALQSLADTTVLRLNALYREAHARGWDDDDSGGERSLASAFAGAEREAGGDGRTVPGRPRRSLLDFYFRSAAVAGMTDPFFLETLVASDLLPFERPFVIAHEWSHLAGFADEGDANFVGWLTCLRGSVPAQYSGWLSLYTEVVGSLPQRDRSRVSARLDAGPRADLRAMADRLARNVSPAVSSAGWRVYDRYLKANRVEDGTASYTRVIRLALGTDVGRRATATGN